MRVLKIWDGDYPWDIRVEKFCNALGESGDEVHLVCRNLARNAREELYKGIHLHRLPSLPRLFGNLNKGFTFPAFFSPIWLSQIYKHCRKHACEVIIVRDLPMAPAAIAVGRLLGRPVIMDMAECYPEMLRSRWQHQKPTLIDHVVRNPRLASSIERWVVKNLDAVLVVVEESKKRLVDMGVDPSRVFIVSNTPEKARFDAANANESDLSERGPLEIIYVGLVNASRGLDTAVDAVDIYAKSGGRITLRVIGTGAQLDYLRTVVHERDIADQVVFEGWIENSKVPALLARADAGLVPHHSTTHWQNTIPNKLFDYMAVGKPVIATRIPPVARVIDEAKCGLLYDDYDAGSLASIFQSLTRERCRELGANGRRAVAQRYNWDAEKPAIRAALVRVTDGTNKVATGQAS